VTIGGENPVSSRVVTRLYRIGEASEMLGVRVETLRRWERQGKLRTTRTRGGQRLVPAAEVARLLAERRPERSIAAVSRRNAFPGVITKVVRDKVSASVEIQAGPHRVLALITREAADELGLAPGMEAVATVKATSVMVELPG
jgi:molybdopterin-binding protein